MTWYVGVEMVATVYLITMGLITSAAGFESALIFKVIPVAIGIPLAVVVVGQLLGWPL